VGSIETLGCIELPGWGLDFTKRGADGSGKCTLNSNAIGSAWAVMYAIAADQQPTLDRIEGLGNGYEVHWMEIPGYAPCYVYLAQESHRDRALVPFDWYKALVLAGARFHGFPTTYLTAIESVVVTRDVDEQRRAENMRLIDATQHGTAMPHA